MAYNLGGSIPGHLLSESIFAKKNEHFGFESIIIPGFFDFFGCLTILCVFF